MAVDGGTTGHTMTSMGESLREAHRPTRSLATPKSRMRVGCWNVRTMYTVGKAAQIAREMERYRLDLLGLSEMRWTGAGRIKMGNGYTMIYAGEEGEHQRGVAIMMSQNTEMPNGMDSNKQSHKNCPILLPLQKYNYNPSVRSDKRSNR